MTTGLEIRPRKEQSKRTAVAMTAEASLPEEGEGEDDEHMDSASSSDWETVGPDDEDYEDIGVEGAEDPAFLVLPSGRRHRRLSSIHARFKEPRSGIVLFSATSANSSSPSIMYSPRRRRDGQSRTGNSNLSDGPA